MCSVKVKEPQFPTEGEYSLTQDTGELVVYKNGEWIKVNVG